MSAASEPPRIGASAEFRKTMTAAEQALFTGISGNLHPLYVNETHAAASAAGGRLVFELAAAALCTTALAELGGPDYRLGAAELRFPTPARLGDTLAGRAEIVAIEGDTLRCRVACRRDDGAEIVAGAVELVRVPRKG